MRLLFTYMLLPKPLPQHIKSIEFMGLDGKYHRPSDDILLPSLKELNNMIDANYGGYDGPIYIDLSNDENLFLWGRISIFIGMSGDQNLSQYYTTIDGSIDVAGGGFAIREEDGEYVSLIENNINGTINMPILLVNISSDDISYIDNSDIKIYYDVEFETSDSHLIPRDEDEIMQISDSFDEMLSVNAGYKTDGLFSIGVIDESDPIDIDGTDSLTLPMITSYMAVTDRRFGIPIFDYSREFEIGTSIILSTGRQLTFLSKHYDTSKQLSYDGKEYPVLGTGYVKLSGGSNNTVISDMASINYISERVSPSNFANIAVQSLTATDDNTNAYFMNIAKWLGQINPYIWFETKESSATDPVFTIPTGATVHFNQEIDISTMPAMSVKFTAPYVGDATSAFTGIKSGDTSGTVNFTTEDGTSVTAYNNAWITPYYYYIIQLSEEYNIMSQAELDWWTANSDLTHNSIRDIARNTVITFNETIDTAGLYAINKGIVDMHFDTSDGVQTDFIRIRAIETALGYDTQARQARTFSYFNEHWLYESERSIRLTERYSFKSQELLDWFYANTSLTPPPLYVSVSIKPTGIPDDGDIGLTWSQTGGNMKMSGAFYYGQIGDTMEVTATYLNSHFYYGLPEAADENSTVAFGGGINATKFKFTITLAGGGDSILNAKSLTVNVPFTLNTYKQHITVSGDGGFQFGSYQIIPYDGFKLDTAQKIGGAINLLDNKNTISCDVALDSQISIVVDPKDETYTIVGITDTVDGAIVAQSESEGLIIPVQVVGYEETAEHSVEVKTAKLIHAEPLYEESELETSKSVTPTGALQVVKPSSGYVAMKEVVVEAGGSSGIAGGYDILFKSLGEDYMFMSVIRGNSAPEPIPPKNGTQILSGWSETEQGGALIEFPYTPADNTELYAQWVENFVLGFTGLTNSSGELTWTDDIASFEKWKTTESGSFVNVSSPLDNVFPFNKIHEVTDSDSNVFVAFPKMWIKWLTDSSGNIDGFKVSNNQVEPDYFISDCFLDPSDSTNSTYLDEVWIGKYEASGSSSKIYSKSGTTCLADVSRSRFRTAARAYGAENNSYNGYQQLDISMLTLYNFLCMLYYRTANIQTVFAGRTSHSSPASTGSCDGTLGLNGWDKSSSCVKMLGIENPYGNISKWIDGIYFSRSTVYVHKNPKDYTDSSSNAQNLGFSRPISERAYIKFLRAGSGNTKSVVYASSIGDSESTYVGDYYSCYSPGEDLSSGGNWGGGGDAGLWYLYGPYGTSNYYSTIGARLCRRPYN